MKATKFLFLLSCVVSLFVYTSCDKIEEAATIKVPVSDFSLDIPAMVQSSGLKSTAAPNHFSGSGSLDINDENFSNLKKNQSFITSIVIGTVSIKVTSSSGTFAENITLSSPGIGNCVVKKFDFNKNFNSPELAAFATKVFQKLKDAGAVTVSIVGDTDAQAGENLKISLFFGNIEIKAKVVEL